MATLPAHHQPFADLYRARGDWTAAPVPDFLGDWARRAPDRVALVDRQGSLTYAELGALVRRTAAGLWALGLRPGDSLALQLPNWHEFAIFQMAAVRLGVCYVPLLPQLRAADLEYLLGVCGAAAMVVPSSYKSFDHAAMMAELRPRLPRLKQVFLVDENEPWTPSDDGVMSVAHFLSQPWEHDHGAAVDAVVVDPDALRHVLFTSGTESKPKGVRHSYNTAFFPLRRHQGYFGLGPDDAVLVGSPVGHGIGSVFGIELALFLGGKAVLMDVWNAAVAIETIERERCTLMWATTTFWNDLVNAPNVAQHDVSSLRLALTAGAPVVRALVGRVKDTLGATLVAAYGQSEGHNLSIHRMDTPVEKITTSDGLINAGIEFKLVDADRQTVPAGEPGEFAYRGPNLCLGYLDPEHTTKAVDAEGWMYSGDLVQADAQGYLRVVGRRKDIIIRGGENISPAEVEDLVFKHPAVADVSVIGLADERLGQRTCAVVIARPGATLTLAELVAFLGTQQIAKFKYPEALVLVAEFPRTASGKVRKDVLREQVAAPGTVIDTSKG